jgi:hypothetical protein
MKKLITLLLAAALVLSLAACGGGNTTITTPSGGESTTTTTPEPTKEAFDKNNAELYLGAWYAPHYTMTFNKGGIGRFEQNNFGFFDFKYEIKDETAVITISGGELGDFVSSFELNDDGTILTIVQNGLPSYQSGDTDADFTFSREKPVEEIIYVEVSGELKGQNDSYEGAWNFKVGDSSVLKLVYFADDVDLSEYNTQYSANGDKVTISAIEKGGNYHDATIISSNS